MKKRIVPSELTIDRYVSGEASENDIREMERWLSEDADAGAILSRREHQIAVMKTGMPSSFGELADKVTGRHLRTRGMPLYRTAGTVAAFLVIAVVVTIVLHRPDDVWTPKGDGVSLCIIKHAASLVRVADTALCSAGDTVQIFHTSGNASWVMLLYAEHEREFIPCLPGDTAVLMPQKSTPAPIPFSIVIDTTTGILNLAFAVSRQPFSVSEAIESLKNPVNEKFRITHYTLVRE